MQPIKQKIHRFKQFIIQEDVLYALAKTAFGISLCELTTILVLLKMWTI